MPIDQYTTIGAFVGTEATVSLREKDSKNYCVTTKDKSGTEDEFISIRLDEKQADFDKRVYEIYNTKIKKAQ
mgnify:CR=1 FL=1